MVTLQPVVPAAKCEIPLSVTIRSRATSIGMYIPKFYVFICMISATGRFLTFKRTF